VFVGEEVGVELLVRVGELEKVAVGTRVVVEVGLKEAVEVGLAVTVSVGVEEGEEVAVAVGPVGVGEAVGVELGVVGELSGVVGLLLPGHPLKKAIPARTTISWNCMVRGRMFTFRGPRMGQG